MANRIPAKSNKNELRRRAKALHDEVDTTAATVGEHAKQVGRELRNGVAGATEQASRVAEESYKLARNTAASYVEQGRQRATDMEQNVESYITERPLRSVAIAAGIGFIAGLCLLRRF
ncbi:MAG: DUF883 family protein [Pirellulales bacterium]|nr:DUF883 family protein [Pirellulales bacterium]